MAHAAKAEAKPESSAPPRLSALDVEAHLRDPGRKQAFVTPMFDIIAPRYDDFTRLFSFGMDAAWKRAAIAAAVGPSGSASPADVLDLASGTGDLAVGIARAAPRAHILAVDASTRMIAAADHRLATRDADVSRRVRTMVGDMTALSLPDACMDLVMAGYGVRNVPSATNALGEMRRVLRPGGRLVLLDFYRPMQPLWRALFLGYLQVAGNVVGWLWHRDPVVYGYIARSIDHFMSWQECSDVLAQAGFRVVRVTRYLGGGVARHEAVAV